MSQYHVVEVIFDDQNCLVEALEELGMKPEVHADGTTIRTYYRTDVVPKCHVVVRKGQFNGMGDIGFEKTAEGKFVMHCDDYDYGRYHKRFSLENLNEAYGKRKLKKFVRGTSRYNIVSEAQEEEGTRVRLRVMV